MASGFRVLILGECREAILEGWHMVQAGSLREMHGPVGACRHCSGGRSEQERDSEKGRKPEGQLYPALQSSFSPSFDAHSVNTAQPQENGTQALECWS